MPQLDRRKVLLIGSAAAVTSAAHLTAQASASGVLPTPGWRTIPEFKSEAPHRASFLEPGLQGERLTLLGRVLTTTGQPVARARIDFWHTDRQGKYDYAGYHLRGYQLTDANGRYRLQTVMPGYYSPIRHVHFLVAATIQGPVESSLLTNAIEFPTDEENRKNPQSPGRSMRILPAALGHRNGAIEADFDLVLDITPARFTG